MVIGIDARHLTRKMRGIPFYIYNLCLGLSSSSKHSIIMFLNYGFEHNDDRNTYRDRIDSIMSLGGNIEIVEKSCSNDFIYDQLYLPVLVKKYKVDVLHMPANRFSFFIKIPQVVTFHDIMEYKYLRTSYKKFTEQGRSLREQFYKMRQLIYAYYVYRIGIKKSSQIITVSDFSKTDILEHFEVNAKKVSAIHHGYGIFGDSGKLYPVDRKDRRRQILMLGGDSYQKNPELAIRAWEKLSPAHRRNFVLRIVGISSLETSPIIQLVRKLNLQDSVTCDGWVSDDDLDKLYRESLLLLFPSRYEGFGFPLLHSMRNGTPIVTTNVTSIPEVVGDAACMCGPDQVDLFSNHIAELIENEELWTSCSVCGLLRAELFSWEKCIGKHLDVYERAVKA